MAEIPEELQKTTFCITCYQTKIIDQIELYNSDLEKAKDIIVFAKDQGKETRTIKRLEDPLVVTDCLDEAETVLKLAFRALRGGFNGLVDFEAKSTKDRNGSYQKVLWQGTAVPAHIDVDKLPKDKSFWHNPN